MEDESTATEGISAVDSEDTHSHGSSESSFYGGLSTKRKYERALHEYDDSDYWRYHDWNIQTIALKTLKRQAGHVPHIDRKRKRSHEQTGKVDAVQTEKLCDENAPQQSSEKPAADIRNDGVKNAENSLGSTETVDEFLTRLKPSTSDVLDPWLWITNRQTKRRVRTGDVASFRQVGTKALDEYMAKRREIESANPSIQPSTVTRRLQPDRLALEEQIIQAAQKYSVVCGKWMLFPRPSRVDETWAVVVRATAEGRLGCSAKVATKLGQSKDDVRLLCIYTEDCFDKQDVRRVLGEIKNLGLLDRTDKEGGKATIYYKCDAYTHLDIKSGNEYRLKASMYCSSDF